METISTTEKIKRLKQELANLEAQERAEKEEARKQKQEEKTKQLEAIKTLLAEYNEKYNDTLCLGISRRAEKNGSPLAEIFSWL